MKLTRRTLLVSGAGAMAAMAMPHVARAQNLPRNIRMVIGSTSTGGAGSAPSPPRPVHSPPSQRRRPLRPKSQS